MPASRRAFLGAAAVVLAAGCSRTTSVLGLRRSVRVAVSWSGWELRTFQNVLDHLGGLRYPVEVIPLGDDISTALDQRLARRADVIMLPQPGLIGEHADALEPIPVDMVTSEFWDDLRTHRGVVYGLPFKTAHKSAVWYRPSVFKQVGVQPPRYWSDWLRLNRALVDAGIQPLSLAAGDGWTLTDFFENLLLGIAPTAYRTLAEYPRLSETPQVAAALRLLGLMWSAPGTLAGGVERSLVQQFPDAVIEVFGHQRAVMVLASDFAEPVVRSFAADPDDVDVFTFPAVNPGEASPVVVGGEMMVLPKPTTEDALDLVRRLSDPQAVDPWVEAGGFLADGRTTGYSRQLSSLAEQLAKGGPAVQFDLSDRIGALGGMNGLWRVLTDFLVRIGGRGASVLPGAVEQALADLRKVEG